MKYGSAETLKNIKTLCGGARSCLTDEKVLASLSSKRNASEDSVARSLNYLAENGFIETLDCVKKGERKLLVSLSDRAINLERDKKISKRTVLLRLALAVLSAIVTYILGRLLVYLF